MQRASSGMASNLFKKGDKIEVRLQNEVVVWCPATFLRSTQNQIRVQFETLGETDDQKLPLLKEYVRPGDVRPAPPPELHRYLKVGEMVEGLCREKKGWRKGHVVEILENSKYTVSFEVEGQEDSVVAGMEQWELRAFREWADGCWAPPFLLQEIMREKSPEPVAKSRGLVIKIKCSKKVTKSKFVDGMLVEVKSDEEAFRGSLYTAVIVKSVGNEKLLVEYRTLRNEDGTEFLKEEVDISCIRHCPPFIQRVLPFEYLDRVDVWYNDGWWEGYVVHVLNGCKYTVHFTNADEELVFEHCKLRPHQEWVNGKWSEVPKVNLNDLSLKRKCSEKVFEPVFKNGTLVEVKSDEEGYQGSWYTATVVCSLCSDKYLVEYQTLKMENKSELLRETAFDSYIRPFPPEIVRIDRYRMLEEVDAWYNDGWWVGLVSKVLDSFKYAVYFWTTNEELIFEHCSLRPHQEWVNGKWSEVPKVNLNDLSLKRKRSEKVFEPVFKKGTLVEVKSDEEGYQGSWYTATVVCSLCSDKYLVEYQTLKMENKSELLRETAFVSYIRPFPPEIVRIDRYRMLEEVDAWYNDGWWVGLVSKVLDSFKYAVYFWTTNEELIFEHCSLRPHQEWVGGKWSVSFRKPPKFVVKNKLGKCMEESDKMGVEHFFMSGMRVEVRRDSQGYRGSWYPAAIVKPLENRKYLVEYVTLETEDGTQLHREEADAACIRPCPFVVQRKHRYKVFEEVDAWYNEGWWVGQIYQALEGRKYTVYFSTTDEILEFQHSELRPHQDWVNRQWTSAKRGRPTSNLK